MRRSMLFLPGNAPKMIINGNYLGSDAVIFDLEDAVAPDQKDAARLLVRNVLRSIEFNLVETIVRINSIDTPYWQADIDEILPYKPGLILLPKTGSARDVQEADAYMTLLEQKLGLAPKLDYEHAAIGVLTVSPAETAVITADIALKSSGADLGFVDRFSGTLIITGKVAEVEAALKDGTEPQPRIVTP